VPINPFSHTFGDQGDLNLTTVMNWDRSISIVDTAVDCPAHDVILSDPSPLDLQPLIIEASARAMLSQQ
jgi:hypothetical protein